MEVTMTFLKAFNEVSENNFDVTRKAFSETLDVKKAWKKFTEMPYDSTIKQLSVFAPPGLSKTKSSQIAYTVFGTNLLQLNLEIDLYSVRKELTVSGVKVITEAPLTVLLSESLEVYTSNIWNGTTKEN